jgi:hypothetical protein
MNPIALILFHLTRILLRNIEDFEVSEPIVLLVMLMPAYSLSLAVILNITKW